MSDNKAVSKMSFIAGRKPILPVPSENIDRLKGIYKWGADNLYPQQLNYWFNNNAIHSGIIRSKVHYITSGGLKYKGSDLEKFNRMLNNGGSDFDLNEVAQKLALDFELSNMMVLKGKWSLDKSYCEKIEWIDYEEVRKMVDSKDIVVSKDWSDNRQTLKIYKPLDLSDRSEREFYLIYEESPKQSKLTKDSRQLSKGIYPTPPYSGGLKAIQTGISVDTYQLSEIENGFSGGTLVSLNNGEPQTEEDKDRIESKFKDATGPESANPLLITYAFNKDNRTTVENLNGNDLADRYTNVDTGSTKKVLYAHSVTAPILFGVKEEGSLGNATELEVAYTIMKQNYFANRKNAILSLLNYVGKNCNGLTGKIEFEDVNLNLVQPEVVTPEPVKEIQSKFSSDDLINELSNCGKSTEEFSFIQSYEVKNHEENFIERFLKDSFAELTEDRLKVMTLINEGQDFNTIRKALDLNSSDLARTYSYLILEGYLDKDGGLTRTGKIQVAKSDVSKLSVVFTYELRKDAPELVEGGTSRDFCKTLIRLNRAYTREEINLISTRQGYNVFGYKGGWYHNPNTDKNEPSCRHTWVSNIVFQ